MRLLVSTCYYYYGNPKGVEPQFYYLYRVPESLGHEVDFFDYWTPKSIGLEQMRRIFLAAVRGGQYDAVFIATHKDEFDRETLAGAKAICPVFAWNSDDEWRWDDYSKERVEWYTYMVTNSPEVYRNNKEAFPNLLHAQWACTGFWDGRETPKDIDFSFVGQVYGTRSGQIKWLKRRAGLKAYGKGTGSFGAPGNNSLKSAVKRKVLSGLARVAPAVVEDLSIINFEEVNLLWNRSKISFTPLESSVGAVPQIKSRVFDMGLSGTLMLSQRSDYLDTYYEPDKEYVPFETLEECAEKAKFYLKHEPARKKIATAYAARTEAEHMWRHRIEHVLDEAGLQ
jgi:hypothetical protein